MLGVVVSYQLYPLSHKCQKIWLFTPRFTCYFVILWCIYISWSLSAITCQNNVTIQSEILNINNKYNSNTKGGCTSNFMTKCAIFKSIRNVVRARYLIKYDREYQRDTAQWRLIFLSNIFCCPPLFVKEGVPFRVEDFQKYWSGVWGKKRRRKSQKRDFNVVFIQRSWIGIVLKFLCGEISPKQK